ncbi:hypothetical protein ZIOFF_026765 [Zingiber officinale]|uniref:Ubiquinone biosynthesis protein n=1 Tax=Zingiber officinale TaxID=94328 RepID=A0A8J5H583_ZINOF|nr:hypothetical protein ZIOFF_026765 [Zingiber officinale]
MDYCLQKLIEKVESGDELKNELKDLTLSDRLTKLIRIRLEMQAPYIAKWPQALSIQAQPANLPNSFKQRAELIDEIWHAAGDSGSDFDWYVKRTILGGIYSTTEVYMLTDHSPGSVTPLSDSLCVSLPLVDFRDTWVFLDRRVKDAFDLQKTVQEAAYLAEAVGAGVGNTVKGFMAGIFPEIHNHRAIEVSLNVPILLKLSQKNELRDLSVSDRVTKLLRIRLEMQAPYIAKWQQALSIKIWLASGDSGSDFDWCVKRTMLENAYSTTEVYMLTDHSPGSVTPLSDSCDLSFTIATI